uniref:Retrotransposon protein, putative, Ty3-gypsy sub-class n=2 Tax=Oryza sativa subsp. japonica TaxID=39947 RepID=Q2R7B0_ORYSJ|nr:retrotransposon protein, putative, Ty3-gypsy sub-class [Oryza sativa Japonica Group]ABA92681.1 retrotransposon protein, putative, Ty3-gypsy subclass [Oryza sativa Japonica Group]
MAPGQLQPPACAGRELSAAVMVDRGRRLAAAWPPRGRHVRAASEPRGAPLLPDSGSSDAPVYFEIVAEVPPATEQGKSCLSLDHVDPILQMF